MLKYEWSFKKQHSATLTQNNKEEAFNVKCIVTNNYTPSLDYRMKQICSPFVQGYDERDGWILLEFWYGSKIDCELYIEYINDQIAYQSFIENNNYEDWKDNISETEKAIYFDRKKVFTEKNDRWLKYIEEYEKEAEAALRSIKDSQDPGSSIPKAVYYFEMKGK